MLAAGVVGQLRETGLDHPQPRAGTHRFEGELDIGPARIVLGQVREPPGEPEHRRLLDPFDPHVDREPAPERHLSGPSWAQVDRRLVTEPGGQTFGRGERGPHLRRRVSEFHAPLDPVRKPHRNLLPWQPTGCHNMATDWLRQGQKSLPMGRGRTYPRGVSSRPQADMALQPGAASGFS